MKVICTLLAVATIVSAPASDVAAGWYSPAEGDLAGRQALQFSVEELLTLSEFQGQMLSYQRFLTDDRAVRVACGLFLDRDDSDLDVDYEGGSVAGSIELTSWYYSGTVKVQMLFYRGDGPVRFFWGAGPKVTYTDVHGESANHSASGEDVDFILFGNDTDRWEVGLQGFAGVEWFVNDFLSLHAEYAVSGAYMFEDKVEQRVYPHDPGSNHRIVTETSSPEFNSDGVRFGLSARF